MLRLKKTKQQQQSGRRTPSIIEFYFGFIDFVYINNKQDVLLAGVPMPLKAVSNLHVSMFGYGFKTVWQNISD